MQRGPDRRIRQRSSKDEGFILSSWRRSYRDYRVANKQQRERGHYRVCNELLMWVPLEIYKRAMYARIMKLLNSERCKVLVACNPEDENQIFGWVCFQPGAVHYVYVKDAFRRQGIATELVRHTGMGDFVITHWTRSIARIARDGKKKFTFDPSKLEDGPCGHAMKDWKDEYGSLPPEESRP